jgi:hypothetical protein
MTPVPLCDIDLRIPGMKRFSQNVDGSAKRFLAKHATVASVESETYGRTVELRAEK